MLVGSDLEQTNSPLRKGFFQPASYDTTCGTASDDDVVGCIVWTHRRVACRIARFKVGQLLVHRLSWYIFSVRL